MKRFLIGAATAALMIGTAYAADMPVRSTAVPAQVAPISWSGFYVGINGGYGWGKGNSTIAGSDAAGLGDAAISAGLVPGSVSQNMNGGLAGGTLGYNWQLNSWVFGIEGDMDWSGMTSSSTFAGSSAAFGGITTTSGVANVGSDWIATVRGRFGYLMTPSLLIYATGGAAFADVHGDMSGTFTTLGFTATGSAAGSYKTTRVGWTAGGGVEGKITDHWSWKAEYRYVDLGSQTFDVVGTGATPASFTVKQDLKENQALFGINYRF